ncbi:MAG: LytR C-terminal domain-containing protein [Candidatus Eisenbacteria bacterium]
MSALVLVLVILAFGFSIASRVADRDRGTQTSGTDGSGEVKDVTYDDRDHPEGPHVPRPPKPEPGADLPQDRVQLLIENGCGVTKLAMKFADEIRGPRFDVVDYRDADRYDYLKTLVLTTERGRQEALEVLEELQARYGVGEIQLTSEPIFAADVRVILGADLAEIWNRRSDVP